MQTPQEIELKLLVPLSSATEALQRLRRVPALRRRASETHQLLNRYFDTPALDLHRQRCALRLRQTDGQGWRQTLKTAGHSQGGLSQRGEWETAVPAGRLSREALHGTAWDTLDPAGELFTQLQPCFETHCLRTTWQVRTRDGSHVEVAFDAGQVLAGPHTEHWLELELELVHGPAERLFELAQQIAAHLPVLPCDISKAERGYALAAQRAHQPVKAQTVPLPRQGAPLQLAAPVLAEIQGQLQRNLEGLLYRDDPELVHQARVAWRRWRSVVRLLRPWLPSMPPAANGLGSLLEALGALRDLDVAVHDTLPGWEAAYTQGSADDAAPRQHRWALALDALRAAAAQQRTVVRQALAQPAAGAYFVDGTHWLYLLARAAHATAAPPEVPPRWATDRLARWHRRLDRLLKQAPGHPDKLHDARLLAKRLRYASEAIAAALPKSQTRRSAGWTQKASAWQASIGLQRDVEQAALLLQRHGAPDELTGFMRGVAAALHQTPRTAP